MTMMDAIMTLDKIVDESDPDVSTAPGTCIPVAENFQIFTAVIYPVMVNLTHQKI